MLYYTSNLPSWLKQKDLDQILSFSIDYLKLDEDILLHVKFCSDIDQLGLMEGKEDDEYLILINRTVSEKDIIETIFHELVHLKQIHSGDFDQDRRLWKGDEYHKGYFSLPWEKEAYYHEEIMSREFFSKGNKQYGQRGSSERPLR